MNPVNETPHVIVVGGGFGGLSTAAQLAKEGFRVTLIDRHPYNTFQPLLYQVATGGLNAGDVTYSLRFFAAKHRGVRFRRTVVVGLDHDAQEVVCDDGIRLHYDYLVVATGITTNHFGIPGAAEYSMSMYTRAEALRVRDTLFGSLEIIASDPDPEQKKFTVLITGGGATGVEMAGQLAELKTEALPTTFPEMAPERVQVVLVEMAPFLLAPFDDSLRQYAHRELVKRGVDVPAEHRHLRGPRRPGGFQGRHLHAGRPGRVGGRSLRQSDAAGVGGFRSGAAAGSRSTRITGCWERSGSSRWETLPPTVEKPLPQLAQPAMQTGKHAGQTDRPAASGRGDGEVQLLQQGHHGHDRAGATPCWRCRSGSR